MGNAIWFVIGVFQNEVWQNTKTKKFTTMREESSVTFELGAVIRKVKSIFNLKKSNEVLTAHKVVASRSSQRKA